MPNPPELPDPAARTSRRALLRCGALSAAGFTLSDLLRREALAAGAKSTKSVILLWMDGGASQHDTFDPKPDALVAYRGEFSPIATSVPGVFLSDGLPATSKIADRMAIVRSLHHSDGLHEGAVHWVMTGHGYPGQFNPVDRRQPRNPAMGSVVAHQTPRTSGVALPYVKVFKDGGYEHSYQGPAFLGRRHEPLMIGGNIRSTAFTEPEPLAPRHLQAPALELPTSLSFERVDDRRKMVASLDALRRGVDGDKFNDVDLFRRQAFDLLTSRATQQAFDLTRESDTTRLRYGRHLWGQGTLLARRLVESGVRFVTVNLHGDPLIPSPFSWDTHVAHFPAMKDYLLPQFDQLFSALVVDLDERGLLDSTLVVAVGEFGRTPKIFSDGRPGGPGRAHWPQAFSAALAGGGVRGGNIVGATDTDGALVKDRPCTPADLLATIYSIFGIDFKATLPEELGRPIPILPSGAPINELFA